MCIVLEGVTVCTWATTPAVFVTINEHYRQPFSVLFYSFSRKSIVTRRDEKITIKIKEGGRQW